jgi:hypothetical protein
MTFIHVNTIDGKNLWLNLDQVCAFSYSPEDSICLVEISGGEPHQISLEEFSRIQYRLSDIEKEKGKAEALHAEKKNHRTV